MVFYFAVCGGTPGGKPLADEPSEIRGHQVYGHFAINSPYIVEHEIRDSISDKDKKEIASRLDLETLPADVQFCLVQDDDTPFDLGTDSSFQSEAGHEIWVSKQGRTAPR
jgi:hypothetical protein